MCRANPRNGNDRMNESVGESGSRQEIYFKAQEESQKSICQLQRKNDGKAKDWFYCHFLFSVNEK